MTNRNLNFEWPNYHLSTCDSHPEKTFFFFIILQVTLNSKWMQNRGKTAWRLGAPQKSWGVASWHAWAPLQIYRKYFVLTSETIPNDSMQNNTHKIWATIFTLEKCSYATLYYCSVYVYYCIQKERLNFVQYNCIMLPAPSNYFLWKGLL